MGKANNDADMQMKTLDGIDLLKGLSKEDKQTICTSMREKVYKAGRMIICEGDEGNTFYIIACASLPLPPLAPPRPPPPVPAAPPWLKWLACLTWQGGRGQVYQGGLGRDRGLSPSSGG